MTNPSNQSFNGGLINSGEISEDAQRNALFSLIKEDHIEEAISYISRSQDASRLVNLLSPEDRRTALFLASQMKASQKSLEMAKMLMDKGANVNHSDSYGQTPLFFAAAEGNLELVSLLIEKGAKVNDEDGFKQTALFYASREGHIEVVKEMIAKGAEVDHLDQIKETPLFYAASRGKRDMCELLVQNGANVNAVDDKKQTAMFFALKSNHLGVVEYLQSAGALKTRDGRINRVETIKPKSIFIRRIRKNRRKHHSRSQLSRNKKEKRKSCG